MPALIAASSVRTCLGDGEQTFARLLAGDIAVGPLRHPVPGVINVTAGYHLDEPPPEAPLRASTWLARCVSQALDDARIVVDGRRVAAVVGTGLRELAAVESFGLAGTPLSVSRLHFGPAVRQAAPGLTEVITIANACSAGTHALALAQDMIETGDYDAVVVGAADAMTTSMLAMIGKVAQQPTDRVRPFDRDRTGVLLGEGAAAVVVVPMSWNGPVLGRLLSTGLSCDAVHETAPDVDGICRAMDDAYARAGVPAAAVDLVVAHGTGTGLNDPAECAAMRRCLLDRGANPMVTGLKGAIGHMSGAAGLANLDVALRSLRTATVPPIAGLETVLAEGAGIGFVRHAPARSVVRLAQVNAFGFGGVNAVTLVGAR